MSSLLAMLLISFGPLIVGVVGITDDDEAEMSDDVPADTADDPVEMTDVASFIENARDSANETGTVEITRGTDANEEFTADANVSARHDASGGQDAVVGSDLNDTLSGGDGNDVVQGGDGNDALFGAFSRDSRADDDLADTLEGGAGDDALFLGDDDRGTGGEGRDVFSALQDATGTITITDFNAEEDAIVLETPTPDDLTVTEQVVEDGFLRVEISTGLSIRLEGLSEPLADGSIQFVPVTSTDAT